MKFVLLHPAIKLNRERWLKKGWQKAASVLAAVVVFCTTYALILPAITMEKDAVCGLEAHEHADSCYNEQILIQRQCAFGISEGSTVVHTHDSACYDPEGALWCQLPEIAAHVHADECYTVSEDIPCALTEEEGHTCTDECVTTLTELTCGIAEELAHQHDEACIVESELVLQNLICETQVHVHEDSCYPLETEEPAERTYLCGTGEHTHGDGCRDAEGNTVCSIPAHSHEAACLVADLDLTADVEYSVIWEATLSDVIRTGNWPEDVLAVARTQLGYRESEKNCVLEDGSLKGYTRYGAWYGNPYGDWSAMFVSFCLDHAGVEDFPLESGCAEWIGALEEEGLYAAAGTYEPKPGDLIFFDDDLRSDAASEIRADRVGLVVELIGATGNTPAQIKTIEGNVGDKVDYVTYDLDDAAIIGYGMLPVGDVGILTYTGADYSVTVTYGSDADIPRNALLEVREILAGTAEYETYYQQSVQTLLEQSAGQTVEELDVSFARFFDISFVVDGVAVEPAAPVDIQICYDEGFEMEEADTGLVVHFADDGVEVINADTYTSDSEQTDTFRFTQDSFSVSGTVVANSARAVSGYSYREPTALDTSGSTRYVIYTKDSSTGKYYAIRSTSSNVYANEITFNDDGSIATTITNNMLWTFSYSSTDAYVIKNVGSSRYLHAFDNSSGENITTSGAYASSIILKSDGEDIGFIVKSNSDYPVLSNGSFAVTQTASNAAIFYLAAMPSSQSTYHVWFDGTNGGLMNLYGSDNTYLAVSANNNVITLPSTWTSPSKYPYTLNGWYDIVSSTYYPAGAQVTIDQNTVFYADWNASTYDVGQANEHTVDSLDTSNFITTYVFDYNSLFNVHSLAHTGYISASGHNETWTILNSGKVSYNPDGGTKENTLNFMFVDYDSSGDFSYALDRDKINTNQGNAITNGILEAVASISGGTNLLDLLFDTDPDTFVIGQNYVGTGNYLFQYMDSTTSNYDGEHDGYYYLDARLNAASYNQSEGRFYLYDYLERTSDSRKDGSNNVAGMYSDFLPFNSPYLFDISRLEEYTDPDLTPGYEYDAKDNYNQNNANPPYNEYTDAITNYFFGIRSDIEFFLPNDSGTQDRYGNYGNISTRGEHMVFDFHGDDDVWVFVDDELLLDIGGLHGIMHGEIDFSTGTVTYGRDGSEETKTFEEILGHNIGEGTHTMTVYYMERGSSQSNCAIYFNIAPRYNLEITKEDIYTAEKLDGAIFSIYTDEACTTPAQLWDSEEDYHADMNDDGTANSSKHEFTVTDGVAKAWGLSAGKTYYIKETKSPEGYPSTNDDVIRITLNNRGTAEIETTTLHGPDGVVTEGYAVIEQNVNDTLKIVSLLVTNQKDEETTQIRVKKVWDSQATDLPNSITVYLNGDGVRVGRAAVLTEDNGWTYTWTGLPKYRETLGENGELIEIVYTVEEIQVAGFETQSVISRDLVERIEWTKTAEMEDGDTYILLNGGRALAYNPTDGFYWMTQAAAQDTDNGKDAQWIATTNEYGFRLQTTSGYYLTYSQGTGESDDSFYGTTELTTSANPLNQVIYYLENRLVVHDHDAYFQLDLAGDAVSSDGLVFSLVRKDLVSGTVVEIENTLVENHDQTFVEVNKEWDDALDHSGDSVTVHLLANGVDTGRYLVLSEENSWHGIFDGLAYADADGNPIVYTVVEDEPPEYDAKYEYGTLAGRQIVTWIKVEDLSQNGYYRIVSGANALSVASDGTLTVAVNDSSDTAQWWTPVTNNNRTVLKHYSQNVYLYSDGTNVSTVTRANSASAVTLNGEVLMIGSKYLQMTRSSVSVSEFEYNATLFTVAIRTEATGKDGTEVNITNIEEVKYLLPITGSLGTSIFTFGGLLILAVALVYSCMYGHKRRKGGR